MILTFQRYRLTVKFDEGKFKGQTISFGGEQLEDGPFLASPLFIHRPPEELSEMIQAIKRQLHVEFEMSPPLPQTPCKIKGMFHSWGELFILFEEGEEGGELAGQAVRWIGELLTDGFYAGPFCAEQITPQTYREAHPGGYNRDLEIIGELDRGKYPALIQAIKAYSATEEPFGKHFKIYL